jgi:hypothetical protein
MDTEIRHRLLDLDAQIRKNKRAIATYDTQATNRKNRRQQIGWYW